MLDTLIRDISARWGLADQGRPLVQMLVAYIGNPASGGLPGFLDQFRKAGWGGMVNTWVDSNDLPEMPTTAQVETVLGSGDGLINRIASRLGLSYDKVIAAVAGVLPLLVGRMTPDGTIPATLPAEFLPFAQEGKAFLGQGAGAMGAAYSAAGHAGAASAASSLNAGRWWPWLIGAFVVLVGISYCSQSKEPMTSTPAAVATRPAPAEPAATPMPVTPTADANTAPDHFTAPEGAAVMDGMHNSMPMLRVFFDTGKTDVAAAFADKAAPLVAFLKTSPEATVVISGFNDPTGDPARNAELSKQRAQAVKTALEAAGVPADRAVLEKPAETTVANASNPASRRVDVRLHR